MADVPKKMLLHVLLARTIRLMAPLEQVQKDRKGQHRLYQAKVLPEYSWSSFLACEQIIAEEYDVRFLFLSSMSNEVISNLLVFTFIFAFLRLN